VVFGALERYNGGIVCGWLSGRLAENERRATDAGGSLSAPDDE